MIFRPRSHGVLLGVTDDEPGRRRPRGRDMDLGTRALWCGVGALAGSWIPLLNIVAFVAALMAIGFGGLARWPTGWIANEEPDPRCGMWGIVLGVLALIVFVVTSLGYAQPPGGGAWSIR